MDIEEEEKFQELQNDEKLLKTIENKLNKYKNNCNDWNKDLVDKLDETSQKIQALEDQYNKVFPQNSEKN